LNVKTKKLKNQFMQVALKINLSQIKPLNIE
jgi:hypothetical protein